MDKGVVPGKGSHASQVFLHVSFGGPKASQFQHGPPVLHEPDHPRVAAQDEKLLRAFAVAFHEPDDPRVKVPLAQHLLRLGGVGALRR